MKRTSRKLNITIGIALFLVVAIFGTAGYSHFYKKNFTPPPPVPQYVLDERINIVATWISEDDANYQLVFDNNGQCYSYYAGSLIATYSFDISNSTPQCGIDVLVDVNQETSYLQLTNNNDGSSICYEVNGITNLLSLTTVGSGRLVTFNKM